MTAQSFDHERLDVYRLSIDYVARSFDASQSLGGLHRHARDQWLRAAKAMLHRIVAMLTRMATKFDGVAESSTEYHADIDYDYEHCFAEHEHDTAIEETPEP